MKDLSPKEQQVLNFIKSYSNEYDRSPTYTEIQNKFGYKSLHSVQQYIKQLTHKGHLIAPLGESKKRALQTTFKTNSGVARIPIEGKVAAGKLSEAIQDRDFIDIPHSLLKPAGEYFALKIKGSSMIEDCILDDDTVVIRRQFDAHNGQIIIALVENEATIKRFYKKKNRIELHPANPAFDIIHVLSNQEFRILGVLVSVIRRCN